MKNIAVLSSGTDNSGINSAIRAIVRSATGTKTRIYGVGYGFQGLVDGDIKMLTSRDVSGKMGKAGCFLGTGKPESVFTEENVKKMIQNIEKKHIDGLVVIGGSTSLRLSQKLIKEGLPIVAIPSTIQDDIPGTDIALGVDSAVNNIVKCVDKIRSCDSSRERNFLVSVEGKSCGSLALRSAIVTGAEMCLIPEYPGTNLSEIAKKLQEACMTGKQQCITIVSRGWKPGVDELTKYLQKHDDETDLLVRETVLGYVQRGGAPTGFDRLLGTNMGALAFKEITKGESAKMVAIQNNHYVTVPYDEVIGRQRPVDKHLLELFEHTK